VTPEHWRHVRRGLALAASLFEHEAGVPMRCAVCRVERGYPCSTEDQQWHDTLMDMIARIEAEQGFQPRCPECRVKQYRARAREPVPADCLPILD
jgi:hypothetical protein